MNRKETPLEWLNYATHYLDTFDVTKSEKLVILKRYMTREILDWSKELEKDAPELRYDEFVNTLRERLINGEVLCSKKEILRSLKYTRDQDPREFVSTIRDALRIVKPGFTSSELCEKVLDRLSVKMARRIEDLGITSQLDRILGVMIRSHEDYLEREKVVRKVKPQGRSNDYGRKMFKHKGLNKHLQGRPKEDTINHRSYKNSYNLRPIRMSDLICYNCNRKGHTQKYCWFNKKESQKDEEKRKEELKSQAIRKQVEQKDESTFRNVFAVTNEKKNTELESSMDPCVKVSVLDDNREKVDELKALIDTGSHVSLTSWVMH